MTIAAACSSWAWVACVGGGSGGAGVSTPSPGLWQGADLTFRIEDSTVVGAAPAGPWSCAGDGGCKGTIAAAAFAGSAPAPAVGQAFAWQLTSSYGQVTVSGSFSTPTLAAGTFDAAAGPCCSVKGAWSASWVPGSTPASDAGKTDAGPIGPPPGWGASSTGSWHPAQPRAATAAKGPADAGPPQAEAAGILEKLRAQLGVPPAVQVGALNAAAQAHASFYVAHKAKYDKAGLSPHKEDASFGAGFTGVDPSARAKAAGYPNPAVGEVMAFTGSPAGAIAGWIETVYHRVPLVHPGLSEWGYGQASSSKTAAEVINAAHAGSTGSADLVVLPWPGQTGVAASWSGNEGPQPPPPPGGYPSGPVITARFAGVVAVTAHDLFDGAGTPVPHVWLDAANDKTLASFDAKTVVLYAHKPLAAGSHRVRLQVKRAGQAETVEWTFKVGP